jgi:hypothetical protein
MYCLDLFGQADDKELSKLILEKDSLFWTGYNTCNYALMESFLAQDVEFYHDKGGVMMGLPAVMKATHENICGNPNRKTRREVVPGTVRIFPMKNGDKIYGAVISGDHYFYGKQTDQPETRDGLAKFTHLWLYKDDKWKMYRILSYDHGPAPYLNMRKISKQTDAALDALAGIYSAPQAGKCIIKREEDHLLLVIGGQQYHIFPQSATSFFSKDRDLTFEFIKTDSNINKMVVREKGKVVEEAVFVSK